MSAENNNIELFERYLQHRLDDKETKEFESRLKIDPDFAEAFNLHKEIDMALLEEEIMFFRAELERMHEETKDIQWEAPMMLSKEEASLLDEAILDQDVMSLRDKLSLIHDEVESDMQNEYIPKLAGIEKAVADQNSELLFEELGKFEADNEVFAELTDEEVLDEEIEQAIMQTDVMELRGKLGGIAEELMPSTKIIPLRTKVIRAVSAAAVIMILASSGLFINNITSDDYKVQKIIEQSIQDLTRPGSTRGPEEAAVDAIAIGFKKFNAGDYLGATEWYKEVDRQELGSPETWIRQGESHYFLEQYKEALIHLNKVIDDGDNGLEEEAELFVIHCLWRLDRKDEVYARLEAILNSNDSHDLKEEAQEIINLVK